MSSRGWACFCGAGERRDMSRDEAFALLDAHDLVCPRRGDLACRVLADALKGVIWGMAADCTRVEWGIRWEWTRTMTDLRHEFTRWLLDQARPPGCRAPWERE